MEVVVKYNNKLQANSSVTTKFYFIPSILDAIMYNVRDCHKQRNERGNGISYLIRNIHFYVNLNLSCVCIFFIIYLFSIISCFFFLVGNRKISIHTSWIRQMMKYYVYEKNMSNNVWHPNVIFSGRNQSIPFFHSLLDVWLYMQNEYIGNKKW